MLLLERLMLEREEGRKGGDGEILREGGAEDEGRGIGTGLLVPL